MIIANSQIQMSAKHEYQEQYSLRETTNLSPGPSLEPLRVELIDQPVKILSAVDLSKAGSLLAKYQHSQRLDLQTDLDSRSRVNRMILEAIFESITGRALNLKESKEVAESAAKEGGSTELQVDASPPLRTLRAGNNVVYQRQERYEEHERMQFQAQGTIRTQDGREISISVDLGMSRDFVYESNLEVQRVQMIDPLVINFDGLGAQLSQTQFSFDLDSDGTAEQLASLKTGSGFLALDKNGDGIINNGSELFGPNTGSGFAELAVYDEDGNNFIDEADSIYHQLRIWMTNEDGSTQLVALGDKNIGAIYLGHVSSPFQLKDENNNSLGEIANSGIYLKETGEVGVVQELNLRV